MLVLYGVLKEMRRKIRLCALIAANISHPLSKYRYILCGGVYYALWTISSVNTLSSISQGNLTDSAPQDSNYLKLTN